MSRFAPSFDAQDFLQNYWQKSPLLLRKIISVSGLIESDELAGLALEPSVESRLIQTNDDESEWHLKHGPLSESDFEQLPAANWTLLVQAVDHWVPEVRSFMKEFSFIPEWRLDDIMISYATDHGGVGPHFDQYDVFLVQLEGKREWKLGQLCNDETDLADQMPVKIMTDFEEQERWVLEPGDILYLPPGYAHWGNSVGNSMTLSVGFRAPSHSEIVSEFGHFLSSNLSEFDRYTDADLNDRKSAPHEITDQDVERIQKTLRELAENKSEIAKWFGQYMTEPKYDDMAVDTGDWSFEAFIKHWQQTPVFRNASSRIAYDQHNLFVDGQILSTEFDAAHAKIICETEEFDYASNTHFSSKSFQLLVWELLNAGAVFFED